MFTLTISGSTVEELIANLHKQSKNHQTIPVMEVAQPIAPTPEVAEVPAIPEQPQINEQAMQEVAQQTIPELDAAGIAWNPMFHTSTKLKTAKGFWKLKASSKKTGLPADEAHAAPVPASEPVKGPVPEKLYATPPGSEGLLLAHTFDSFKANFIPVLSTLTSEGKITPDYINQLKAYFGIKEIWNLLGDEIKLLELFENFCSTGLIKKVSL